MTKVAFSRLDERVLPDMSAKVAFLGGELSDSAAAAPAKLTVPTTAIAERDGKQVVFTIREGRAEETPVRTAERLGTQTVVTEGLSQGETVVNRPPATLSGGAKVKTK